jgi:hypothetical protein
MVNFEPMRVGKESALSASSALKCLKLKESKSNLTLTQCCLAKFKKNLHVGISKSWHLLGVVIPAGAGIQLFHDILDPGFRRGDGAAEFVTNEKEKLLSCRLIKITQMQGDLLPRNEAYKGVRRNDEG